MLAGALESKSKKKNNNQSDNQKINEFVIKTYCGKTDTDL